MRKLYYLLTGFLILSLSSISSMAQEIAKPSPLDPRIKSYTYAENTVYVLKGHYGFTTVIEFSPEEIIESIAIGDSEAWQITPANRPNIVYIKPVAQDAQTNMSILTSKRMYIFELTAQQTNSPRSKDLSFRIRFHYPEKEESSLAHFHKLHTNHTSITAQISPASLNFNYSYAGDRALKPKRVFDDGTFTYIEFKKSSITPAIFAVDEHGNENLINFSLQGPYLVIHTIKQQINLRDGKYLTCLFNNAYSTGKIGNQKIPVPVHTLQENKEQIAHIIPPPKPENITEIMQAENKSIISRLSMFQGRDRITLNR